MAATISESKKDLFENVPVRKALMSLAVPAIISQLINLVYNTVDTMFIGQTGDAYKTAAVTLIYALFSMTKSFSNLFGIGGGSLIARLSGSGKPEKARGVCSFSFYAAIASAAVYSLLVLIFLDPLLRLLGASENTMVFARQYTLIVVVLGNVPVILSSVTAYLLQNAGYSKQAGFGLSGGGILNIVLDPLFMFVLLPKGMEVIGAALATLVANVIACAYLVIMLRKAVKTAPLSLSPRDLRAIGKEEIREVFSVGIPSAILTGLFEIAHIVLNHLMSVHGDLQLAAIGIVSKLGRLPTAVNVGLCHGMMPLVSYNFASGNHRRMNDTLRITTVFGLAVAFGAIALFEIFTTPISRMFMNTSAGDAALAAATVGYTARFLRIAALASPFQFINFSTSYSMQAVGYGKGAFIHSLVRQLGFYIPFLYLLDVLFGADGLAGALIAGELCGGLFALWLFARWKRSHVTAPQA